jgi:imidazole glycerol phosphate synthase glutamine amidotransferase subunit
MEALARAGLVAVLRERINRSRPLLAICLGMQLLYEWSEESPGVVGLGVIAGGIRRFAGPSRVPHMGWNLIRPELSCGMLHEGWVYFANSFRAQEPPAGWKHAFARYDGDFVAGIERGPVLACQFHPELSGSMGRAIIRRWMHASAVPAARETGSC